MSLAHVNFLSTRALLPLHARQSEDFDINDEDLQCAFKAKQTMLDCPGSMKPIQKCSSGGVPVEEMTEDTPVYADRESCIDMCNMFNGDTIIPSMLACMKDQCENYDAVMKFDKDLIKEAFYPMYMPYCEKLGLTEVVSATKTAAGSKETGKVTGGAEDPVVTGDAEKEDAEKEDVEAEEKGEEKEADAKSEAAEDEEEDSAASALAGSGWKSTGLVVAMVFGSLFSAIAL